MVSKPQVEKKHKHTLISWITHIKHSHDSHKNPSATVDPVIQRDSVQHDKLATNIIDLPPKANASDASISSKKKRLIHFHRPHGFLFRHNSTENIQEDDHDIESTLPATSSSIACTDCQSRPASQSTNDADDESTTNDEDGSMWSVDGTKRPTSRQSSIPSQPRKSRESSVHTLPADVDNPLTGFKKLGQDGYMMDLDDSFLLFEEEKYDADNGTEILKGRVRTRSVIYNKLIRLALNRPFQSPLQMEDKRHILHVGCSNGSWCIDTANLFPHCLVVGIDDKTGGPWPDPRKVPRNFKYIRCYYDLLRTLKDLPGDSFDLVYSKFLGDAYGEDDYLSLIKECQRICKPNGYVEFYELDMRIHGNPRVGPITHAMNGKLIRSMEVCQLNPRLARKLGDMVSNVMNSHASDNDRNAEKKYFDSKYTSLPLGVWGGRLGVLFLDNINELICEDMKAHRDEDSDSSSSSEGEGIPCNRDIRDMNRELGLQKTFMNLHHVYARKRAS